VPGTIPSSRATFPGDGAWREHWSLAQIEDYGPALVAVDNCNTQATGSDLVHFAADGDDVAPSLDLDREPKVLRFRVVPVQAPLEFGAGVLYHVRSHDQPVSWTVVAL